MRNSVEASRSKYTNRASYGNKLNKMNDDTYALRRNVMSVIYEAKNKGFNLPRIEVRIVSGGESNVCGYAYLNSNVVHITEKWSKVDTATLTHLVLHEIVHAVTGYGHSDSCYLMQPIIQIKPNLEKSWSRFAFHMGKIGNSLMGQ